VLRIRDVSLIPDPDFYPSWIRSQILIRQQQQKRRREKLVVLTFFWRHKFYNIEKNFSFEQVRYLIQKNVTKLSEIWVGDPRSGKKPIPDPGGQKSTGSRIRICNTVSFIILF
jgi:hypothetical protein